jgi:SM-20-related protein
MIEGRFFQMLGFLVEPNFLTSDDCGRIRREMAHSNPEPAGVVHDGKTVLDPGRRSTKRVDVGEASLRQVEKKLSAMRGRLERHFGLALQGCQEPQFLLYQGGDFFRLHADTNDFDGSPEFLRQRKVSAVIFIGQRAADDRPASHLGGELVFHGLIDDPRMEGRGFSFPHDVGTLLAFPSHVLHEVTPVTRGQRYTMTTWFF